MALKIGRSICVVLTLGIVAGCPTSPVSSGQGDTENDAGADVDDGGEETSASGASGDSLDAGSEADDGGQTVDAGESETSQTPEELPIEIDPTCTQSGCLRSKEYFGAYTKIDLVDFVEPGVEISNGYRIWLIHFMTDGREARANITVPYDLPPPADGWHIVANNPGTVGLADACALGNTVGGTGLSGYFGARGLIGVSVDYPGLGTEGIHPYLVSDVEGKASLDALRAAAVLMQLEGVPISDRYAVAGLSQGGHATLAAAALHAQYAPDLDVRAFAAAAPASVWLSHWTQGFVFSGPHQAFYAMAFYAWQDHYGATSPPVFHDDVIAGLDTIMDTHCIAETATTPALADALPQDPAALFHADFVDAMSSGDLSAYPNIQQGFDENAVFGFEQNAPLAIYQGTYDEVVLKAGTDEVVAMLEGYGIDVDYHIVHGGSHTTVAFFFLAYEQFRDDESVNWLKSHLDADGDDVDAQ